MEKLKESVFKLAKSKSNNPLTPSQIAFIEKGLLHTFSSLNTPTHPTYHWMIQHAVADLDKEGSLITEEIISEYLIKNYKGLPWAHKRYLKHHLDILCKREDLFCDINGCYIHPDKKDQTSSKRKRLKRGKREVNVVAVENLSREEVNDLCDSQVGFQEVLGRGKRRRWRSYIFDDDEDDEVVGERNRHKGYEMVVRETRNQVLLLKGREAECESSETHKDDHGNVDIAEGKFEPKYDIECTNKVNNQVVVVDHVVSERGRKGLEMSVLPTNMMNILPVVTEGGVMKLDHSDSANALVGSVESVGDPLASVPNFKNDSTGSLVKKSVLQEKKSNLSINQLMIVPYVENSVNSIVGKQMSPSTKSVDSNIVCGLPCKRKLKVYHQRKRSKHTQEKANAMEDEEPVLASLTSSVQKRLMTKVMVLQTKLKGSECSDAET